MAEEFTRDWFAGQQGTEFGVDLGAGRKLPLVLAEVSQLVRTPGQETFSLLFRGPGDPMLQQGTVELSHETLGEMLIFLVPIGKDDDGVSYEAIFNRMVQ